MEMKNFFTRFTNDAIASAAFGIEVDSLKNPKNEFYLMGREMSNFTSAIGLIKSLVFHMSPKLFEVGTKASPSRFSKKKTKKKTRFSNVSLC